MTTKIESARLATNSGVTVVIASGSEKDVITRLASGESIGTRFLPATTRMESRKRWMLSGLRTAGRIIIDSGAATALKRQNRSLLAAGIKQKSGSFERGDVVDIYDTDGVHLGCGITNYSSRDVEKIMGVHSANIAALVEYDYGPEVIHRNNLAVL
jgi:glutamate 5-kinase